jgi:hypothetical protein
LNSTSIWCKYKLASACLDRTQITHPTKLSDTSKFKIKNANQLSTSIGQAQTLVTPNKGRLCQQNQLLTGNQVHSWLLVMKKEGGIKMPPFESFAVDLKGFQK